MPAARVRWLVLSLLFFATTVNYLDRIVFSLLIPVIRQDLRLTDLDYGYINGAFQLAYTLGFLFMGRFIDWADTKIGYLVSMLFWSVAAALHSVAGSGVALGAWRFLLGLGESGNFPSAIKSVAEWFPKKDRAFATGIFNSGTNVAATIGPPVIIALAAARGWRATFLITAGLGLLWIPLWSHYYRKPPIAPEDDAGPSVSWLAALRYKETWGFTLGKFLTDPVWWFYLIWLPPYFFDARHFNLKQISWALPVIYLAASFGSVGGGWISSHLIARGWRVGRARKAAMLLMAACMPVAVTAVFRKKPDGGNRFSKPSHFGPSGLVGQPVHYCFRHISFERGGVGRRHRRLRRRPRRLPFFRDRSRFRDNLFRICAGLHSDGCASSAGFGVCACTDGTHGAAVTSLLNAGPKKEKLS